MNPSVRHKLIWLNLAFIFILPQSSMARVDHNATNTTFKLHVWHAEVPDMVNITDDWKPVPPVNSAVVRQIKTVRKNLPAWSGVHNIVPGVHAD